MKVGDIVMIKQAKFERLVGKNARVIAITNGIFLHVTIPGENLGMIFEFADVMEYAYEQMVALELEEVA